MFFYGFVKTPISWRPLLPSDCEGSRIRSFSSSRWTAPPRPRVFLEGDDRLSPLQLALQPTVLRFELFDARIHRSRLGPALGGPHPGQRPAIPLLAPRDQVRAVQPLTPQQGSPLAGLLARVGFLEDPEPIFGAEPSAHGFRRHFRVGRAGRDIALDRGRPSATGRLASLVAPPLRLSHDRLVDRPRVKHLDHEPDTSPPLH
jgi:hypothetical protein